MNDNGDNKEKIRIMEFDETIENNARLPSETALAYKYYLLYCAMLPEERSLRALGEREVNGKKRSKAQFGKWSKKYNWQERVRTHDGLTEAAAYEALMIRRKKEIEYFVEQDMQISQRVQKLCIAKLDTLDKDTQNIDFKELRQLTMIYKEAREWIKECARIQQEDVEENE